MNKPVVSLDYLENMERMEQDRRLPLLLEKHKHRIHTEEFKADFERMLNDSAIAALESANTVFELQKGGKE